MVSRKNSILLLLLAATIVTQTWIARRANTWIFNSEGGGALDSLRQGWDVSDFSSATSSLETSSALQMKQHDQSAYVKPRILIGILSDSHTQNAKVYRDRHRKLFTLWNDTRLCAFNDFASRNQGPRRAGNSDECQVLYTFVLGAYTRNSTSAIGTTSAMPSIPTVRLYDTPSNPLTLPVMPVFQPQYSDAFEHSDSTILNIVENMNDGKTPTFLYWASETAKQWKIPYVAKCDSDAFLRLQTMLQFLETELPVATDDFAPSVLTGALRHKAYWETQPVKEQFWTETYYSGMHLYLSGSFYLMSRDLAEASVNEARRLYGANLTTYTNDERDGDSPSYLEGHEDHDAVSMIQVEHEQQIQVRSTSTTLSGVTTEHPVFIQWIVIPKNSRFFEHPVKGNYRWERIWTREQRRKEQNMTVAPTFESPLSLLQGHEKQSRVGSGTGNSDIRENIRPTLLVVLGATNYHVRQRYRDALLAQGYRMCNPHDGDEQNSRQCDLHFFFAIEGRTLEDLAAESIQVPSQSNELKHSNQGHLENDVVELNHHIFVDPKTGSRGILQYIHELSVASNGLFDLILFCQASHMVNISQWVDMIARPLSKSSVLQHPHHLLVGDVRDKAQRPREFKSYQERTGSRHTEEYFFNDQHENIHLYLGGECFALSSTLLPILATQANNPKNKLGMENHLGHDLSYLAYKANRTIIHWVPISRSHVFWNPF